MERQLFTAQGRPAHTQCGRSLRHHVINQPNFCKASPWLPFPLGRQRPGCRVQGRGPGPWQADPLPRPPPPASPRGSPHISSALPLLSAGLKKSSEKKTEDSRSLGTSPRRCLSCGTRAPVKFSLSKTSTARTGGWGGRHHTRLPTPAVESPPRPLLLPNGPEGLSLVIIPFE